MANKTKYNVVNCISYKQDTAPEVVSILDTASQKVERISILCGNTKTGKPWSPNSQWHTGYVGVGNTMDKLPVLLAHKRSGGGLCIMDASIIEIRSDSPTGTILYTLRPQNLTGMEKLIADAFSPNKDLLA